MSAPTDAELRRLVLDALARVAPNDDASRLAPDADLREELEIDSMDVLNLAIALHEATGSRSPRATTASSRLSRAQSPTCAGAARTERGGPAQRRGRRRPRARCRPAGSTGREPLPRARLGTLVVHGVTLTKADNTEVPRPVHPSNVRITKLNLKDPRRAERLGEVE